MACISLCKTSLDARCIESGKRDSMYSAVISPIGFIALATVVAPASR